LNIADVCLTELRFASPPAGSRAALFFAALVAVAGAPFRRFLFLAGEAFLPFLIFDIVFLAMAGVRSIGLQ